MASIIVDGPRDWALDVLDRKLGRAAAAVAGTGMLVAVFVIHPGPARLVCAGFSGVLLLRSTIRPPQPAVTVEDLAELEALVLLLRDQARTEINGRLDRLTDIVTALRSQVR